MDNELIVTKKVQWELVMQDEDLVPLKVQVLEQNVIDKIMSPIITFMWQ